MQDNLLCTAQYLIFIKGYFPTFSRTLDDIAAAKTSLLCAKSGRVAQNWDDVATKKPRLDTRPHRHFLC